MDIQKTGRFIAELRRERGLTQQQLGELVGATNKTVSRWETGSYMPPIEVLELLSKEFSVSINEIVAGERLSVQDFRSAAEQNLADALKNSAFSLKERQEYFKKRWLKNHAFSMSLFAALCIALLVIGITLPNAWIVAASAIFAAAGRTVGYNMMMAYIEKKAFEKAETSGE